MNKARNLYNRKLRQFKALDLVGVTDIANMAGCPVTKVGTYIVRGKLPQPLGEVSGRPVWFREQVEPYLHMLKPTATIAEEVQHDPHI
jgi:hypothetical protein